MKNGAGSIKANQNTGVAGRETVAAIGRFPFRDFSDLREAVADRRFNIGVDALAAAEWSDLFLGTVKKIFITSLSLLIVAAALAAVVVAFWTRNYWLLLALPVQAATFYYSQPASPVHKWATAASVGLVFVFVDLLLNRLTTAATLVAYAALTFAAVRAAGFIANAAFRKALLADESLFVAAYTNHACTVRDNAAKRVYEHKERK
jgi:hypothetical protein